MPPKKKGKGKGKGKKGKKGDLTKDIVTMKNLLRNYERNCNVTESQPSPTLKSIMKECLENGRCLSKFILEPANPGSELPVLVEPVLNAIRQTRYDCMKDLHIWNYPMSYENMATLAVVLEKPFCNIRLLELLDCLIEAYPIHRLTRCFPTCSNLTTIVLDYNEFGDDGCAYLCEGLMGNGCVISVSMCFCGLGIQSGKYLGKMVSETAVRELYLDGNDLDCEGTLELIKLVVDHAESEAYMKAEEQRQKEEEKKQREAEEKANRYKRGPSGESSEEGRKSSPTRKKKKGGKKKKAKGPPPPPPVGPWLYKLHIADNSIDGMGKKGIYAPVIVMRLFKKLLAYSECLEELDLEDNLIGDLGGQEILNGLNLRKEAKLPSVKLKTTHRMSSDIFNSIVKLGGGLNKKKKKGKKKKK